MIYTATQEYTWELNGKEYSDKSSCVVKMTDGDAGATIRVEYATYEGSTEKVVWQGIWVGEEFLLNEASRKGTAHLKWDSGEEILKGTWKSEEGEGKWTIYLEKQLNVRSRKDETK